MSGFRILTCHSTRAGRASITVVDASTGATIVVSGLPFDHDYAESQAQVCRRIGNEAAPVLRRLLEELEDHPDVPGAAERRRQGQLSGSERNPS